MMHELEYCAGLLKRIVSRVEQRLDEADADGAAAPEVGELLDSARTIRCYADMVIGAARAGVTLNEQGFASKRGAPGTDVDATRIQQARERAIQGLIATCNAHQISERAFVFYMQVAHALSDKVSPIQFIGRWKCEGIRDQAEKIALARGPISKSVDERATELAREIAKVNNHSVSGREVREQIVARVLDRTGADPAVDEDAMTAACLLIGRELRHAARDAAKRAQGGANDDSEAIDDAAV